MWTILSLPNELLLLIFQFALQGVSFETRHFRASFALVATRWRDLIYNTPSFWTTIHDVHNGPRNSLALIKSGSRPLDIVIKLPPDESRELFFQICDHCHRWKTAHLTLPLSQQVADRLNRPAPLIESLTIQVSRWLGPEPVADLLSGEAPRLRALSLNRFAIRWNAGMLLNLRTLNLNNIRTEGPTIPELLSILKASPDLSSLLLRDISFQPHLPLVQLPSVHLPRLTHLQMAWLSREDIETLLNNIRSPHCQTVFVGCFLDVDADLTSITTAMSPFLPVPPEEIPHATPPNNLTIDPECLDFSVHFTPHRRVRVWFDTEDVPADAIILRLLAILPQSVRNHDASLALWPRYPTNRAVSILDAANVLHIMTLTLTSSEWKIDRLVEHLSLPRVFPALRVLRIDISDVSPGVLASSVQARYGPGGIELPMQLTIGGAKQQHGQDREVVESIIGSDRVVWSSEPLAWEDPETHI